MGNSKSGISTIFNLLERFNQRERGNIFLMGKTLSYMILNGFARTNYFK